MSDAPKLVWTSSANGIYSAKVEQVGGGGQFFSSTLPNSPPAGVPICPGQKTTELGIEWCNVSPSPVTVLYKLTVTPTDGSAARPFQAGIEFKAKA